MTTSKLNTSYNSTAPTLIILMLDCSSSVLEPFDEGQTKLARATSLIHDFIISTCRRCVNEEDKSLLNNRYQFCVIGYSNRPFPACIEELATKTFITPTNLREIKNQWLDMDLILQKASDPECDLNEAFLLVQKLAEKWTADYSIARPPLIINISSDSYTGSSPASTIERIETIENQYGQARVFNLLLSHQTKPPIVFPKSEGQLDSAGMALFNISSKLAPNTHNTVRRYRLPASDDSRSLMSGFSHEMLNTLLDIHIETPAREEPVPEKESWASFILDKVILIGGILLLAFIAWIVIAIFWPILTFLWYLISNYVSSMFDSNVSGEDKRLYTIGFVILVLIVLWVFSRIRRFVHETIYSEKYGKVTYERNAISQMNHLKLVMDTGLNVSTSRKIVSNLEKEINDLLGTSKSEPAKIMPPKFSDKQDTEIFLDLWLPNQNCNKLFSLFKSGELSKLGVSDLYLKEANLSGANLRNANLEKMDFSGANLHSADLRGSRLVQANLEDANLSCADLKHAYLCKANLTKADLRLAILQRAQFDYANLEGANLEGAYVGHARFCDAHLINVNWTNAADLDTANWAGAKRSF